MHAASLGEDWKIKAQEEAGISMLENMSTTQERSRILDSIKLVFVTTFICFFFFLK
jgi:hypothetical protein